MTEVEWLEAADPEAVAEFVYQSASNRQLRLIACGCCRMMWDWLSDERSRAAVEVSERFADGLASSDELGHASYYAEAALFAIDAKVERYSREQRAIRCGWLNPEDAVEEKGIRRREGDAVSFEVARLAAVCAEQSAAAPPWILLYRPEPIFSFAVVHDVMGNPFRRVAFDPAWRTSDAVLLARGIYDECAFDRLPVLAGALQDAGCSNEDILNHCCGSGPHVRGCRVVDLVLGKE